MLEKPLLGRIFLGIIAVISLSYFSYAHKCELKGLVNGRVQCILHDRGVNWNGRDTTTKEKSSRVAEEMNKRQHGDNETWKYSTGLDLDFPFAKLSNEKDFKRYLSKVTPDTRWCGEGFGTSEISYEDLVFFTQTEKCCKKHDSCNLTIEAKESANELTNLGFLPRYHCSCETDFRNCLKKVNSPVGNKIGSTYFTAFRPQCFREDYPTVECTKNKSDRCLAYRMDRSSKKKKYQWFDVPVY